MAFEFKFPDVGEGITEGEIVSWKVKEGDVVKIDQVLAEVETDKAIVEIPSPKAGTILKLHVAESSVIKVGSVMVTIGESGETTPAVAPAPQTAAPTTQTETPMATPVKEGSVGVVGELEEAPEEAAVLPTPETAPQTTKIEGHSLATPVVRKLAKDSGVDINKMQGSGIEGRVTKEDIQKSAGQEVPEKKSVKSKHVRKYDKYGYIEHVPLKGMRKAIAKHMRIAASTAVHVTGTDEIDVTDLWEIRQKEKVKAKEQGVKLTLMPFIIKACQFALQDHPYLNATMDEEADEIILKKYYNLGIAIDTPDGLMVPVIKGIEQKSILDLAKEIQEISAKAVERKIDIGDLKGSTFSITNYGSIGGVWATPIINYPESAILGVGRMKEKPVVREGRIVGRKMLPLSLTFDHRITDGAEAQRFLNQVKEYLEDPDLLFLKI